MALTDPQSFNRYSYVSNNPVNSTDPSGMSQRPAMVGGGMDGGGIAAMFRSSSDDYTAEGEAEYEKNLEETRNDIKEGEQIGAAGKSTGPAAPAAPQNTGNMPTPCDQKVAATFGSDGAVGRTSIDYNGIFRGYDPAAEARLKGSKRIEMGNPLYDSEHLYWFPHLSGNQAGTENTDIFIPGNYQGRPTGPTRGDAVVTFYYPQFFGMKNVTLAVFHVGDFSLQRVGDRMHIGRTGGPGGDSGGPSPNRHAHFELWRGNTGFLPPGARRDAVRIPLTPVICGP